MKRNLAVSPAYSPHDLCSRELRDQARNLTLPGAIFSDPAAQAARFSQQPEGSRTNFETAGGKDLWDIRETVIYPEELSRIAKLEHLDEIEELRLVLSHYCVAWGGKGTLAGIGL